MGAKARAPGVTRTKARSTVWTIQLVRCAHVCVCVCVSSQVIAIAVDDPKAHLVNDVEDVEK